MCIRDSLLALEPQGREQAAAIWEEAVRQRRVSDRLLLIPFLLGDDDSLLAAIDVRTANRHRSKVDRYLVGDLPDAELLGRANSTSLHLFIAMKALRDSQREKAMRELELIEDIRFRLPFTWRDVFAAGILSEMRRRPDWPKL